MGFAQPEPIAIVGSGCRFPGGSSSPSLLWKLLEKPRDVSQDLPDERFELKGYYHPQGSHHGTTNVKRAYMLDESVGVFDASFFNISPNEAEAIDPQQRLLMEVVYEALESGGHGIEQLRGSDTAVYVGTMSVDYNDIILRDIHNTPTYFSTGTSRAILANRISYFFDWHGPSMSIDTACSSSMVALHQSVQSLRSGESRVAIAGGTELLLGPEQFVGESKMNLLSPTGQSRMWDANANGYARGDGIAAVVLKRLSDAIADGDHIECLIRQTGVNQDGKSTGLTVPSSEAQAALIKSTYTKAGLDMSDPQDWPQFFEAHGTGTKAGDPREASAIEQCFGSQPINGNPLYVGSIKTIIGHTEGTAGLAGVLKASLAIQRGIIPPNMLLNHMNPDVEQYCNNLHVPRSAISWPDLPEGVPRRASVNSFGFGGTNGHAILESYQPCTKMVNRETKVDLGEIVTSHIRIFTFSAATDASLDALLQAYASFLKTNDTVNLGDLSWTLQSRRSNLSFKVAFSAATVAELASKIDKKLEEVKGNSGTSIGIRSTARQPRILGIFTGQGAQWATMGAHLIRSSEFVRKKMEQLDHCLATLPEADRPSWRIADQLSASGGSSRLTEASFSQPLCTAVQIALVDLLKSAGITFRAVVGHSSGEIAAAYTAGFISARDAIRLAYYRGVHAKHAKGPNGQIGAMMAVGTSLEDAQDLLELPAFKGRVKIAAVNSGASLTLSGDADGIAHAKRVFDEEKKFARMLVVDTAYHSHHMLRCSDHYISSLRDCGIQINTLRDMSCTWYSSVKPGIPMEPSAELSDVYWNDNMVNTVLFADAVKSAGGDKELNLALEIGPHPALKGPALQSLSDIHCSLPYTGILKRKSNDLEAFSDALAFVWTHLGSEAVNFQSYEKQVTPVHLARTLAVGLPAYQWDHGRTFWYLSRLAKKIQQRGEAFHELLGVPSPSNTESDLRWTNFLKASEISWLDGHQLQGQTIFPAAGYVAMALEAGRKLAGDRSVKVMQIEDLIIAKAITFDEGPGFAVETLVTLTGITPGDLESKTQTAEFTVYSCPNTGTLNLEQVSTGKIKIVYGVPSFSTLSSSPLDDSNMSEIDSDTFYSALDDLGYGYSGPFRTLASTKRRLGQASATVATYGYGEDEDTIIVHPTMLDVAFQASFLAQMSPGDGQLWSLHVPTYIKCVRINPELCGSLPMSPVDLPLSAVLHDSKSASMRSSVDIFSRDGRETLIQIEGLVMKPFSPATAADDRPMFSTTEYNVMSPDANTIGENRLSTDDQELTVICERLAYYYLRKWKMEIPGEDWDCNQKYYQRLRGIMDRALFTVESGRCPSIKKEWDSDDYDQIIVLLNRYPESIDLRAITAIGEYVQDAVSRKSSLGPSPFQEELLDRLYREGLGFSQFNTFLAQCMRQITHRYPHTKILEIGARMGHATNAVFESIGGQFSSYTYTDVSEEFVEKASTSFPALSPKMVFKTFDPEQTPLSQGFEEYSYDVVIASNIIHTSSSTEKTTENIRRLLKPGGHLLASGITDSSPMRTRVLLGGFQNWWSGGDTDRKDSFAATSSWHNSLRKAGFSGIDTITPEVDRMAWPFSVIATQAVNDRVNFLRKPLSATSLVVMDELVIVVNASLKVARLTEEISNFLSKFCNKVTILDNLPGDDDEISSMATCIILADLDEPIFEELSEDKIEGLKCLFELSSNILWVTEGARTEEPYHNASIGFGRCIAYEMPHLSLQFLDINKITSTASCLISEALLRLTAISDWEDEGNLDSKLLWSKEPEIYVEENRLLVPRLLPNDGQNERINSLRRTVLKTVHLQASTVSLSQVADSSIILREEPIVQTGEAYKTSVQVNQSILSAINIAPGIFLFVGLGLDEESGKTVITLSSTNASRTVPLARMDTEVILEEAPRLLSAIGSELLGLSIFSGIPINSSILVHGLPEDDTLVSSLANQAASNGIGLMFTSKSRNAKYPAWIEIAPWSSHHVVQKLLPANTTHFLDFSTDSENQDVASLILGALPEGCRHVSTSDLIRHQALMPKGDHGALLRALAVAVDRAKAVDYSKSPITMIRSSQLGDTAVQKLSRSVVDWTLDSTLSVQVQPIDATRLFSKDKTYLLVGLSGQLGQSICEWMSRNGAAHICLTSRNPNPNLKWLATMEKSGTIIKVLSMDVTRRKDVNKVVNDIKATCPPIAGVANGAAVFHDSPFSEMSLEIMEKVTKPKIDGTKHLDEAFGDTELDFFIVFSSLTSVLGNSGQSNYAAANAFMTGLVGQRRKRGLAATSLDIGSIIGIGFMERAGESAREQLIRYGFMAISETDVHQLLAEAIRAGANFDANPVVTTGCRTVRDSDDPRVMWFEDPRLQHKVILETNAEDSKSTGKKSNLPPREQLAEANTMEQAFEILKDCFAAKLAMISRLPQGEVSHDISVVELGIDSLVAVEIRGWFLKELKTDMPVLKVLGGGSITDLCRQALEKLPETLLPNMGAGKLSRPTAIEAKPKSNVVKPTSPAPSTLSNSESSSQQGDNNGTSSTASHIDTSQVYTPATMLSQVSSTVDLRTDGSFKMTESLQTPSYVKSELVSFPQSRFWFLGLLIDDQTTFNVTFYFRVTGNLRVGDLERAIRLVTNRHESLRTCFVAHEKEADLAYQNVLSRSLIQLERRDISSVEDVLPEYEAMKAIPFDLASGKLMRLILLAVSPTEHYLLVNYHHILMDGVSLQNFLADLEKAYQRQPLGPLPCQVPEFSCSQRAALESGAFEDDIAYWKGVFPSGHPVLPLLPMSHVVSRSSMNSFHVHQVECRLGSDLMARLKESSRVHRSTTFHFYLATFKAMLFRFTNTEELTIGIADANRVSSDVMGTIGLLLNLLTLRFKCQRFQNFDDCIDEAREKAFEALGHSQVPFDVLLKELNVPRSSSYSPLFQAFFDYRQGHQEKFSFGSTEFEFLEVHPGRTAYDMTLDITDSADGAHIMFRVQAGLYDETAARLLLNTYVQMLESFASDTSLKLEDCPLYSDKDITRALNIGRGPSLKSSWLGGTLPHRIDQVARENEHNIALKDGHGKTLTYAAMIDRIEAIASVLKHRGVTEGSRVLVFEDATADWPCSMLAIMRLGAIYVPLDLRNPLPRLADVARSCEPIAILVDETTDGAAPQVNVSSAEIINVTEIPPKPSSPLPNVSKPDAVAALLYTSGSTGAPKGIIVKHSGLRNEIEGYTWQWGLKAERVLQQSAFTFNHSSDQMYTGLANGGSVYIVPWNKRGDPIEVTKIIREEGITYTKATPAEYSLWLDHGSDNLKRALSWRFAFGGGESLTATLVKDLASLDLSQLRFFNSYGPTEISISSTKMEIAYREPPTKGRIPCGFSLPNYAAYILDEQRKPVPVGMPGELWIGGAGVSLGYLNNKELTDRHFLHNPYATQEYIAQGWTRMYRTGDIAHLTIDGAMVFHNRVEGDTQVKIRGLRIELEDIESNLLKAARGALKEAAVTLRDGDPPLLVAHVVFAARHQVADTEVFLQLLLKNLDVPQYMVPVVAIPLKRLPLSNHSKTDRKALKLLPLPQRAIREDQENDEELTETMSQLRKLWVEVLNIQELGLEINPSTSFFAVGGNSLLIVRLQSRIRHSFNITIRLFDLLDASTLSEMSHKIEESLSVDLVDWEKETSLPNDRLLARPLDHQPLKTTDKVVLVTGAGGFLGKHILAELIANPDIAQIHCIGLRDKPNNTPRTTAVSSAKIVAHTSDLTEPWLGLGKDKFVMLAGEVDAVLHMAATRSFWDNYNLLSFNNVAPLKELVRMITGRQIPIHYISTAGVIPEESAGSIAASVAEHKPIDDGSNGYIATRWVCEQILERAMSQLGVPVTIHRFVPAKTLADQTTVMEALEHFVGIVDRISLMPEFSGVSGYFEMTPVCTAAKELATRLAEGPSQATEVVARFLHHECEIRINIAEMESFLTKQRGNKGLKVVPGLKFIGEMKRHGLGYFITSQHLLIRSSKQDGESIVLESRR